MADSVNPNRGSLIGEYPIGLTMGQIFIGMRRIRLDGLIRWAWLVGLPTKLRADTRLKSMCFNKVNT
jgi:hypothetical protein